MRRALRICLVTVTLVLSTALTAPPVLAEPGDDQAERAERAERTERAVTRPTFGGATTSYVETGRWTTGDAPDAIAVDNRGRVLVAVDDKVLIHNPRGRRVGSFATGVSSNAWGLTVDLDGLIYVSEWSGDPNAVHVFSPSGDYRQSYAATDGTFNPWGLETHPATGQLWIANSTGDTVERVEPGAPAIGGSGTGDGEFDTPVDIAHGSGSMYVVDRDNDRIQRFHAGTGAYQAQWGQSGFGRGQFRLPVSVDTGVGEAVLVLDSWLSGDSELEVFTPNGGHLATSKIPASNTFGLATDKSGNVYVTGLLSYPRGGWGVVKLSPTATGKARLAAKRVDADRRRNKAKLRLVCPKGRACTGTVRVRGKGKVVASGRYRVAAGKRATVPVKVTAKGKKVLRQRARTAVVVHLGTGVGARKAKGSLTR